MIDKIAEAIASEEPLYMKQVLQAAEEEIKRLNTTGAALLASSDGHVVITTQGQTLRYAINLPSAHQVWVALGAIWGIVDELLSIAKPQRRPVDEGGRIIQPN